MFCLTGLTFEAPNDWPISESFAVLHSSLNIIHCSPNHVNEANAELLQKQNIDNLCNKAFDELLTQEFNPNDNDFKDDSRSEADRPEESNKVFIFLSNFILFF
jgi:hypothetical protein